MSFWPGLQITLEHVFESATGISFVWDDEPMKAMQKPYGILSLRQSMSIGRDYSRYTFRDSDTSIDIIGHRELTINVQIFSRQARGDRSARELIERARLCLANPVYRDELRSAGLIFVENHSVVDLNFSFQNRAENRSAFDVVFILVLHEHHAVTYVGFFVSFAVGDHWQ